MRPRGRTCEVSIVLGGEPVLVHDRLPQDDRQVLRVRDVLNLGSNDTTGLLIDR